MTYFSSRIIGTVAGSQLPRPLYDLSSNLGHGGLWEMAGRVSHNLCFWPKLKNGWLLWKMGRNWPIAALLFILFLLLKSKICENYSYIYLKKTLQRFLEVENISRDFYIVFLWNLWNLLLWKTTVTFIDFSFKEMWEKYKLECSNRTVSAQLS